MGRGTPTGQGSVFQPGSGYGSQQPMASNMRYTGSQQPMVSNTRYTGSQQSNPNALTFVRGPIPYNQQGPAVGGSLSRGLGQIPLQQQKGQSGQTLFNLLRGQPVTQQPMAIKPGSIYDLQPADKGFDPVAWMNQPYTPVSPQPMPQQPMVNRPPANVAAQQAAQQRATQGPLTQPPPPTMQTLPPPPSPPTPGMPQGWNVSSAYRDFGGKLAQMIKSGQLTPQQANAIKDPAFQATRLGNTPEAFAAMQKAIAGLAGYAAGGYVTQVAPEDPRMQAMRYLQRLGE